MKTKLVAAFLFVTFVASAAPQPDVKRQKQISAALTQHGFKPGRDWSETVEILRGIAQEHNWQRTHVPDARVLILLDLGGRNADKDVLTVPPSILEPGLQAEAKAQARHQVLVAVQ